MNKYLLLTGLLLLAFLPLRAQLSPQSISIPMRDGKNLAAHLYLPNTTDTFPVILVQTPYNKNLYQFFGLPLGIGTDIANSNYAIVILDWRCFFGSAAACVAAPKRGEDGYDAVEWIADQAWCNGKVGTWGLSALGNVQFWTAEEQPPHLVCAVPEVAAPWETYHKYYPGGSIIVEHLQMLETLFGNFDLVVDNPYYNLVWQFAENTSMNPEQIEVPMLLVAGWFDHNTLWDLVLIDTLASSSPASVKDQHKILVGPWIHGGLGATDQGDLSFPEAQHANDELALEFFDYHIRGIDNGWEERQRYTYFQMGEGEWKQSEVWPPAGINWLPWFLHDSGEILPNVPSPGAGPYLEFSYDPEDPSPTIGGKTLHSDLLQGPYDQSDEVESRSDALVYTMPVLTEDLYIQGKIRVKLFVSSDRPDTDFALRLTEVYPDGSSILLGEAIQRMRFREGYTANDEVFMTPGEVYPIDLEFEDLAITFQEGNRLRLIVSSSNYPRYNRNMNTGGEMHPGGNYDTLVNPLIASNRVYSSSQYPSMLELPIGQQTSADNERTAKAPFLLYPNPVGPELTIEGPEFCQVELFDLHGRLVRSYELRTEKETFDLSGLAEGVYVVRVYSCLNQNSQNFRIFRIKSPR